uniref:Uncharacterized protein n=1 Tax=Phytophthora ramorum TaxID=164328 RepID=H3H084_PHYRM
MVSETYLRKALAHTKAKYASLQDAHSQLQAKHALLEGEHAEVKGKHLKLQEEHALLEGDRNDQEADVWLWMMQHKKLQDEHAQWKAACAALMEEVERKFLEENYMAELAQQYGQSRWHVAKVAELYWPGACPRRRPPDEETADRLTRELAEAKDETTQHVEATNTLRSQMTALLTSAKTAVASWEASATKKKLVAVEAPKIVKVPTQTQTRCVQRREVELTETLVRLEELKLLQVSGATTVRSKSTSSSAPAPVKLAASKAAKLAAQRLQQSKETKSAAEKESFGWASKTKRLAPSPSPTSSSPQRSRRWAA